jgi:hypothetical protein
MTRSIGPFLLLVTCGIAAQANDETKSALVKKKAEEISQAVVKGDYAKLADLTYPKVVELMGGREKMIAAVETGMQKLKDEGFVLQSVTVDEPSEFQSEGTNTFSIVRTTMEMTAPGGKVVTKSYLLGISADGGKAWTFVDGNGLDTKEKRDKVLPKLPEKLELPEQQKPEFIKSE